MVAPAFASGVIVSSEDRRFARRDRDRSTANTCQLGPTDERLSRLSRFRRLVGNAFSSEAEPVRRVGEDEATSRSVTIGSPARTMPRDVVGEISWPSYTRIRVSTRVALGK
jgi:hypothetical protein